MRNKLSEVQLLLYLNGTKIRQNDHAVKIKNQILDSDFLISDDKCTHRLIGLKYTGPDMYSPVITACCMRHEIAYAKQVAFNAGKMIYHDSKASAKLFSKYAVDDEIESDDFMSVVGYYADHYKRMGYDLDLELEY